MIETPGEVFVILDALDECKKRDKLLDAILKIGRVKNLHLLMTSRKEPDINQWLTDLIMKDEKISIQSELVNHDIRVFVQDTLHTDRELKRWQKNQGIQQEIEVALTEKAKGMSVVWSSPAQESY